MQIILSFLVPLLFVTTIICKAQTTLQEQFKNLQTGTELPETLQSGRSAVFLKLNQSNPRDTIDWYQTADELHKNLMTLYIDAVAYYRWRDLNAGYDATGSYLTALADREISQIIVLEIARNSYDIYIIPTDLESPELLDLSQPAWHASGSSLEGVMENLTAVARRTDLERENFLISESPELFYDTSIFAKNRFESFQPDLKLDKLAVPLFYGTDVESPEHQWDQELKEIMRSQYPFTYELVAANMTEDLMQKAGFHYVLRYLHAEEQTLRTLLDYQGPADQPTQIAYKYYFKHLITGDIYLGDTWDSRPDWQQALMLHLTKLRRSLKVE
ncbi:MAG: hypothetical protein DHS20C17_26670 [Cyclobacteriaceae bacterium]|nr:MAG: hypothetical protein DHS20C17_26670 [Cyclobacteriaceae bacterium]